MNSFRAPCRHCGELVAREDQHACVHIPDPGPIPLTSDRSSRSEAQRFLLGLGIFVGFFAPFIVFALLGYWLWADSGVLLGGAPYGLAFILFAGYSIGQDL